MAKPIGWRKEPARHALAAKGVKTRRAESLPIQSPVKKQHPPEYMNNIIRWRVRNTETYFDELRADPTITQWSLLDKEVQSVENMLNSIEGNEARKLLERVRSVRHELDYGEWPWN